MRRQKNIPFVPPEKWEEDMLYGLCDFWGTYHELPRKWKSWLRETTITIKIDGRNKKPKMIVGTQRFWIDNDLWMYVAYMFLFELGQNYSEYWKILHRFSFLPKEIKLAEQKQWGVFLEMMEVIFSGKPKLETRVYKTFLLKQDKFLLSQLQFYFANCCSKDNFFVRIQDNIPTIVRKYNDTEHLYHLIVDINHYNLWLELLMWQVHWSEMPSEKKRWKSYVEIFGNSFFFKKEERLNRAYKRLLF